MSEKDRNFFHNPINGFCFLGILFNFIQGIARYLGFNYLSMENVFLKNFFTFIVSISNPFLMEKNYLFSIFYSLILGFLVFYKKSALKLIVILFLFIDIYFSLEVNDIAVQTSNVLAKLYLLTVFSEKFNKLSSKFWGEP